MATTGTTILDFGAFPGQSDASVVVTGQAGIVAGSLVEAWIRPVDTADHSADEHMVETLKVFACEIVPGVGFTIRGFNTDKGFENWLYRTNAKTQPIRKTGTRIWGQWTVAWVWD